MGSVTIRVNKASENREYLNNCTIYYTLSTKDNEDRYTVADMTEIELGTDTVIDYGEYTENTYFNIFIVPISQYYSFPSSYYPNGKENNAMTDRTYQLKIGNNTNNTLNYSVINYRYESGGELYQGALFPRRRPLIDTSVNYDGMRYVYTLNQLQSAVKNVTGIIYDISGATFENCTVNPSTSGVVDGSFTVTVTADSGYEFTSNNTLLLDGIVTPMNLNTDNTVLSYTVSASNDSVTLTGVYSASRKPQNMMNGLIHVYLPTNDDITVLASKIFIVDDMNQPITNYITAFYNLPMEISSEYLTETKSDIILGRFGTSISCDTVDTWLIKYDLGIINVENVYGNVYDYNFTAELHVPFFENVFIDIDYVIGKTIKLDLYVNLYDGYGTLHVTSSLTNEVFYFMSRKIVYDLPFVQARQGGEISEISIPTLPHDLTPHIVLKSKEPYPYNGFDGKTVNSQIDKLDGLSGYYVIDDIELSDTIPQEMQTEIRRILSGGVFL